MKQNINKDATLVVEIFRAGYAVVADIYRPPLTTTIGVVFFHF